MRGTLSLDNSKREADEDIEFPNRLGHAGVFLLGGTTRQTPPIPIVLRSGDVLVMAGRGRKCYHGQYDLRR